MLYNVKNIKANSNSEHKFNKFDTCGVPRIAYE